VSLRSEFRVVMSG